MPTVEFLCSGGGERQYKEVPDRDVSKALQLVPKDSHGVTKCYGFRFYDEVGNGNGGVKIENVSGNFYIGTKMSMQEVEGYVGKLENGKTLLKNLQAFCTKEFVKTKDAGFKPFREGDVVAAMQ